MPDVLLGEAWEVMLRRGIGREGREGKGHKKVWIADSKLLLFCD